MIILKVYYFFSYSKIIIKGVTYIGDEQIAECEMKIVIDDSKKS